MGEFDPRQDLEKALGELYRAREKAPGDPSVLRQIQSVRDQLTTAALDRLRPLDRIVRRVLPTSPETPAEAYVVDQCVDGVASIDVILDRSTLGRHRTAQALETLVRAGIVEVRADRSSLAPRSAFGPPPSAFGAAPAAFRVMPSGPRADAPASSVAPTSSASAVVVGDSDATQAALTRTMTRVAIHGVPGLGAAKMVSATSGPELVEVAVRERATLIVTAFQLPGFDALEALRQLRARGRAVTAVVLVDQLDEGFVKPKLPDGATMLARPFDKTALVAAITAAAPATATGTRTRSRGE